MIDSVSQLNPQQLLRPNPLKPANFGNVEFPNLAPDTTKVSEGKAFDGVVGKFINEVDSKSKAAIEETNKMMLGETDNIHSSMIAMQEAGLAFNLMVEVRNKLVGAYQELIKMPV